MEFFSPWKMFVGCWVPNWLCRMPDVSHGAKLCYARLAQFAGRSGKAYPKQSTMAAELGMCERQVRTYLAELVDRRLIALVSRPGMGRSNVYGFLWYDWMNECEEGSSLYDPVAPADFEDRQDSSGLDRQDSSAQTGRILPPSPAGSFLQDRQDPAVNKRVMEKSPEREPGTMAASPQSNAGSILGERPEEGDLEEAGDRDLGDPRRSGETPAADAPRQRLGLGGLQAVAQASLDQTAVARAQAQLRKRATKGLTGELKLVGTDTTGPRAKKPAAVKGQGAPRGPRSLRSPEMVAMQAWWEVAMKDAFPDTILVPWTEKQAAQARMLRDRYPETLIKAAFEYVCQNWSTIRDRYRLQGVPGIGLLVAQYPGASLFTEAQKGGPEKPSEKTGRMKGEYDEASAAASPSVGWGDEGEGRDG